jgi:hypothetical protein
MFEIVVPSECMSTPQEKGKHTLRSCVRLSDGRIAAQFLLDMML